MKTSMRLTLFALVMATMMLSMSSAAPRSPSRKQDDESGKRGKSPSLVTLEPRHEPPAHTEGEQRGLHPTGEAPHHDGDHYTEGDRQPRPTGETPRRDGRHERSPRGRGEQQRPRPTEAPEKREDHTEVEKHARPTGVPPKKPEDHTEGEQRPARPTGETPRRGGRHERSPRGRKDQQRPRPTEVPHPHEDHTECETHTRPTGVPPQKHEDHTEGERRRPRPTGEAPQHERGRHH